MDLMTALGAGEQCAKCGFSQTVPAQMPMVRGAIIDVVRMLPAAKRAFEGHGGEVLPTAVL